MYLQNVYMKKQPSPYRAKLFKNGGSQAMRLPKDCRFAGSEVMVHREGSRLIVEPLQRRWTSEFLDAFVGPPDRVLSERRPSGKLERAALDL